MKTAICIVWVPILLFMGWMNSFALDIGLAWVGSSGMTDRVSQAFLDRITETAPDIQVERQNELASLDDLDRVVTRWHLNKSGMVLLRSNAAVWLGKNPPTIPTFIGACSHPVMLGALKQIGRPDGNITGVTYYLPKNHQIGLLRRILPSLKTVILITEKGHPSSPIDRKGVEEICNQLDIRYRNLSCSSVDDLQQAIMTITDPDPAILIGNQALIFDNTKLIVRNAGTIPVLSSSIQPVKEGALCGFVADDAKLGRMLADSVRDILVRGKKIRDVPIRIDPEPRLYINLEQAKKLNIVFPDNLLKTAVLIEKTTP